MISSINEYVSEIDKIKSEPPEYTNILFRGQSNSDWKIQTSLERHLKGKRIGCNEFYLEIDKHKPRINTLIEKKFERKSTSSGYPFKFDHYQEGSWRLPDMEYLAYLRHHGFPIPLSDWTRSLYIALFFACEDFNTTDSKGKVFIYKQPKIMHGGNSEPEYRHIGKYMEVHKRHISQQSEYLIPLVFENEWEFIPFQDVPSYKDIKTIEIDKSSKVKIMKELNDMNINKYTMYMDEDSLVKSLADEWALENI